MVLSREREIDKVFGGGNDDDDGGSVDSSWICVYKSEQARQASLENRKYSSIDEVSSWDF